MPVEMQISSFILFFEKLIAYKNNSFLSKPVSLENLATWNKLHHNHVQELRFGIGFVESHDISFGIQEKIVWSPLLFFESFH